MTVKVYSCILNAVVGTTLPSLIRLELDQFCKTSLSVS